MAMSKVNKAISDMVKSIEASTVEKVKSFITEKIATEYDEELLEAVTKMFEEISEDIGKNSQADNIKKGKKPASDKKKREPTEYNLFLKEKMAEIKAAGTTLKGKDLMKAAIELWREKKKSNSSEEEPKAEESDAEEEPKAEESDAEEEKPKPTGKATKGQGKKSKK
jgi:hypothetical protein